MAEPTEAEIQGFATVDDVAAWLSLAGVHGDVHTPRGVLFRGLGCLVDTHPRVLGVHSEADYMAVINPIRIFLVKKSDQSDQGREGPTSHGGTSTRPGPHPDRGWTRSIP